MRSTAGVLLSLFVAAAVGCGGSGNSEPTAAGAWDLPANNVVIGMRHHITDEGMRRATLDADSAYFYEDSARVDLRGVYLRVFDEQGRQTTELRSEEGTLDTETDAMVARGSVRVNTTEQDRRIRTEELHYEPASGRIWSDVATTMIEDGTEVRGSGFTADEEFREVTVRDSEAEGLEFDF